MLHAIAVLGTQSDDCIHINIRIKLSAVNTKAEKTPTGKGGSENPPTGGKRTGAHRWELPGNYRDFIVVMVFYLFFWRSKRILVTIITGFKIYVLIQSLMLLI